MFCPRPSLSLSTRCVNRFVSPISLLVNLANTATVTKLSAVRPRSDFAPKPQPVATAPARKRATITFPHVAWLTLVADRIQRKEVGVVVVGRVGGQGERRHQSTSKSGLFLRKKRRLRAAGGYFLWPRKAKAADGLVAHATPCLLPEFEAFTPSHAHPLPCKLAGITTKLGICTANEF